MKTTQTPEQLDLMNLISKTKAEIQKLEFAIAFNQQSSVVHLRRQQLREKQSRYDELMQQKRDQWRKERGKA